MNENTAIANAPMNFMDEAAVESFISFDVDTPENRIMAYNAINNPDARIADMINKTIELRDVVMTPVDLVNEETGEVERATRSILIDTQGVTYTATATGIYNSLRNIYMIFHTLHFEPAIKVEVNQVTTKRGNTLTLKLLKA